MDQTTRFVEVRAHLLKDNDLRARALRQRFQRDYTRVVSLVSSPGAGKTALLEHLLTHLAPRCRVAALVGDLATDHDAARLARSGAPVRQINTATLCHLEARMIEDALADWPPGPPLDLLFIENVGNLVCPAGYDLGEAQRLVLASVTEGEDKPLKYPTIFNTADAAVITKLDLATAVECDLPALRANIQAVRPGMRTFEVSVRSGAGIAELLGALTLASPGPAPLPTLEVPHAA